MKLEEAIKELIDLQKDLSTLPEEIKVQEVLINKLIQEEDSGDGLEVDKVQDIFDITEDITKLKEEERLICGRIKELTDIILHYIKVVNHKKITYSNGLGKSGNIQYVFECIQDRLVINGNNL